MTLAGRLSQIAGLLPRLARMAQADGYPELGEQLDHLAVMLRRAAENVQRAEVADLQDGEGAP